MKKVEIITEAIYLKKLTDLLAHHGIHGYTIIKDIEGLGGHGLKTADDACDLFSNIYMFSVCETAQYDDMDQDLRDFLATYGGKCILSDVALLLGKNA